MSAVCLIVGAGPGLGAALARGCARSGLTVCLARRSVQPAERLAEEIRATGAKAHAMRLDASDSNAVLGLFDRVEREVGAIELVIFNAGFPLRAGVLQTSAQQYRDLWEGNALAGMLVGQNAVRVMQPRGRGTVIFTGATASLRGGAGFSAFAAAKTALRAFAQSLAREFGPKGIHVSHVVIDGGIDSAGLRESQPDRVRTAGQDGLLLAEHIADNYLMLHAQTRDAWTFELDLRPWSERW